jgi:flavin-dependent trigonelline monooxygenase, reductase component
LADMIATTLPTELPRYRQALGSFLTGVTVVTTIDSGGHDRGMTANSFTSVSLDPPLILFCIDRRAASYDAFTTAAGYAVHILGSHQQEIAKRFASKSAHKFANLRIRRSATGAAILDDAHAVLDCAAHEVVAAGDHAVIIARVNAFAIEDKRPLGFYQGKMQSFNAEGELARSVLPGIPRLCVLWLLETLAGEIVVSEDGGRSTLPSSVVHPEHLHDAALSAAASTTLGAPVVIDFLYSVYGSPSESLTLVYRGRLDPSGNGVTGLTPPHHLVPAEQAGKALSDVTERAVAERYINERGDMSFGIYAGSIETGSVATITAPTR